MGALITAKENFHAVSLSGGKDSTCLLLLMIERGLPIDAVIWADTGMEFPEMYGHISKVDEHLYRERGLHITTLRSPKSFEYMMFDEPKQKPSTPVSYTHLKNPTRVKRPCTIQKANGRFLIIPTKPSGRRRLPMQQGSQGRRGADPQRWEKWVCSPA